MTDEYAFEQSTYAIPMESRVLVADSVWQSDEHSEHFSNSAETALSDSYMTAGDNTTQYFSVLETSTETILNDISQISLDCTRVGNELTLDNAGNHEQQVVGDENQEVVLFRVDGSDELYGIQIAQDEEGNLQKYQFQVRQNADGQLETLPETIQLVPFSADENLQEDLALESAEPEREELSNEIPESVFIKQEMQDMLNDEEATNTSVESHIEEEIETEEHIIEMEEDTKEGILRSALEGNNIYQEEYPEEPVEDQGPNEEYYEEEEENDIQQEEQDEEEQIIYHQVYIDEPETAEGEFLEEIDTEEEIYRRPQESQIQENVQMYLSENDNFNFESDNSCMNDGSINGDSEDGTDELHITGQDDIEAEYQGFKQILEDDRNIIKLKLPMGHAHFEAIEAPLKNTNRVVKASEDKNTCAIIVNDEKENVGTKTFHTIRKTNPRSILKTSLISIEEKPEYEKRFAKGKIAVQARQFQNYISQTKILEAPIRQERLPRKQQIKPLKRSGEEIVVQEVVVSSNGFIETRVDGVVRERKPLIPTECIQLSDSDDSSGNRKRKRRSKKNKQIEIVISDSEDELNEINTKVEHKCTKCPKTFPSLGSLKTHMQYHNFAESKETKYKCTQCDESFKNNALLTRHTNLHKTKSKIECNICKKLFSDRNQLQVHKRTHIKDQMFKNTAIERVSPRKSKPIKTDIHKCKDCGKVFNTFVLLNSHILIHKKFPCTNCPLSFSSRLLLDNHRIRNCVKKSPKKKKISFVPRKSYTTSSLSTRRLSFKAPAALKTLGIQVNCDSCDSVFHSHKSLLEHSVLSHSLNVPDKSIGKEIQRKSMYRQRPEHCGIPASKKLKEAFAGLKGKLTK